MRGFIVMAMFAGPLAYAGWSDYEERHELELDADGVTLLTINAGAGSMDVTGVAGSDRILVDATVVISDASDDKASKIIAKRMQLSLQRDGNEAVLIADFKDSLMGWGDSGHIALDVRVPRGMNLAIDDGSGSIDIIDTGGDVNIDDGSGSIDVRNVKSVKIDDGSGSIKIAGAAGDVWIEDGSGSISVDAVGGSVSIDDGSGSISVSDVEHDFTIIDDGSGGLSIQDVRGSVNVET